MRFSTKVGLSFILAGFLIPFLGQVIIGEAFDPIGRVLFPVLLVACGVTVSMLIYRERVRSRNGPTSFDSRE